MLRITKEANTPSCCSAPSCLPRARARNTATLAKEARIAVPMSGKVLKRLTQQGILESIRGAHGGYQLARAAENVTALDVVEAIEGGPELVECTNGETNCALAEHCQFSPFWQELNDDIRAMLAAKTLSDMQRFERRQHERTLKFPEHNDLKQEAS